MFKFFSALARLTTAAETLAGSLEEANTRFRSNVLDGPTVPDVPVLDHTEEDRPAARNGRKAAAR